jgi:hypothetical protein
VTEMGSNNAPQSTGANPSDPLGWDPWGANDTNSHWLSVGGCCGGSGSSATFSFAPANNLSLLCGSPNSDNTVALYSKTNGGGNLVATVSFEDGVGYLVNGVPTATPYGPNTTDPGDIISITSSELFLSAVLTNDIGGFEVADVSAAKISLVSSTPLPSTWTMMLIGFARLGFFSYGGRRAARLEPRQLDGR